MKGTEYQTAAAAAPERSCIGAGMTIVGLVETGRTTVVTGVVRGEFRGPELVVEAGGEVSGDVRTASVRCQGQIAGHVITEELQLSGSAVHKGVVATRSLQLERGAVIDLVTHLADDSLEMPDGKLPADAQDLSLFAEAFTGGKGGCCMDVPWSTRHDLLQYLCQLLERGKPLIKITGEAGSGKTRLAAKLPEALGNRFEVLSLAGQFGGVASVVNQLIELLSSGDAGLSSLADPLQRVKELLWERQQHGVRVVVVLDEAHRLFPATMEGVVKSLTQAIDAQGCSLQLVLLGEATMEENMVAPIVEYFEDETNCLLHLAPLSIKDAADYLRFSLQLASPQEAELAMRAFPYETIRRLHELSGGNLALLNSLADQALQLASAEKALIISPEILDRL